MPNKETSNKISDLLCDMLSREGSLILWRRVAIESRHTLEGGAMASRGKRKKRMRIMGLMGRMGGMGEDGVNNWVSVVLGYFCK